MLTYASEHADSPEIPVAKMQLFVRGQEPHVVDVTGEETVGQLRAQLCALEGLAADEARLSVGGVALADDVLVNSIQAEVELDVGLLGGEWRAAAVWDGRRRLGVAAAGE
ncbi:Ubiquitin-like protein FUBI [Amphibalanus amphitrite]|uniref:Ubiquitin-like protein FUBI n=1 Tax=Amphibalanus amphitrite TaxID=1232801 RepID=A0A6A4W0N3_AMPAM|nr:Ubiquitin-like protein FUBI [Amphibalanus amphitrite]